MEITSGVQEGLLSLPSGGGSLRSLGDRFQPDMLRGTGNYAVSIQVPHGPNQLKPSLTLRYSTGQGNGVFGMGWQLVGPFFILRRSDHRIPRYGDNDEYVLAGGEVLVPVGEGRYRPRSETQFWDIRRQDEGWIIRTKEGRTYRLGMTAASRIESEGRVFGWMCDQEIDPAGNAIRYTYTRDAQQLFLSQIDWSIYQLRFVYENRPDVVHNGRAGFPIRTRLRCQRIERHCSRLGQSLCNQYRFTYSESEGSRQSLLTEIQLEGLDDTGQVEIFPPLRLTYQQYDPQETYRVITATDSPPPPLTRPDTTLVDMNGDGLPEVLQANRSGHRYWQNLGNGSFGEMHELESVPAGVYLGERGVSFADLNGDGTADLMRVDTRLSLAIANTGQGRWADTPIVYSQQFPLAISASDTRLVDLDGDGMVDLLQSGPHGFTLVYNSGNNGWSQPETVTRIHNLDRFPDVALDDPGIHLADMTGDGLTDIVFAASGRVFYWPYYGYGQWGERLEMQMPPVLPQGYDPGRLFLTDLDGDGAADLLYVDYDRVYYWLNQSGVGWSRPYHVPFVPPPNVSAVYLTDLLGTGTRGLLWCNPQRRGHETGYRYLDLSSGVKPYLLTQVDNGFGGLTTIDYTTTSALRAATDGWDTYLPFPLHVVQTITEQDQTTDQTWEMRLDYQRGYYDPVERVFRGFERVELTKVGDHHTPTLVQQTRFYLGAVQGPDGVWRQSLQERAIDHALSGSILDTQIYAVDANRDRTQVSSATMIWDVREEFNDGHQFVYFPHLVETTSRDYGEGVPDRIDTAHYTYDSYGNTVNKRRLTRFENQPEVHITEQRITYAINETDWRVGLPAQIETRDGDGQLISDKCLYYDGLAFVGLPSGQVSQGILRRSEELALLESALPSGYVDELDSTWGFVHRDGGFYRTVEALEHDDVGNLVAQRDSLGYEQRLEYDADHLFPTRMTDGAGNETRATFDARTAQPLEVVTPGNVVTRYGYTPLGRLQAQFDTAVDGTLQLTQYFAVRYANSLGEPAHVISFRPHNPGMTIAMVEGADLSTIASTSIEFDYYDSRGNLLQRSRRAANESEPTAQWIVGSRRVFTRDNEPAEDYPNHYATSPAYVSGVEPDVVPVRFFYAPTGQASRIEHPDGGRFQVAYKFSRIEKWDAEMADADTPIVERYNAVGHLIGIDHPDGKGAIVTTQYTVDTVGRTTQITDTNQGVTARYTYAGPGPAIRIQHQEAGDRTYWRDANGNLRLRVDSLGRRLMMAYDRHGRMTVATDVTDPANPVVVRRMVYNGGDLVEVTEGDITLRYDYDLRGRQTSRTVDFGHGETLSVQREYGLQGNVRALTYPNGTRLAIDYYDNGTTRGLQGLVDRVDYDAHNNPLQIEYAGSPTATFAYDANMKRLLQLQLQANGNSLRYLQMTYDRNGNIVTLQDQMVDEAIARQFYYDNLYRLTRAVTHQETLSGPILRDDGYGYSQAGDITRNDESVITAYRYGDAAHPSRLTAVQRRGETDPTTLVHDESGRLMSFDHISQLNYDIWDRVTSATLTDGTVVQFDYDDSNRRVRKRVQRPSATTVEETRYVENLYETSAAGSRLNFYLGKLLVATRTVTNDAAAGNPSVTAYVLTDHLGSVLTTCDASGTLLHQQVYTPFGIPLQVPTQESRYIGLPSDDELGMVQMGMRFYHPLLARFISPDWFIIENPRNAQRLPQGYNVYSYSINNPIMLRDPTGLWFGLDDLIVAAVGFVVGFVTGIIVGAVQGRSFGETLLLGLEGGLLGAAGAWLAYATAGVALAGLGALGLGASAGVATGVMVGAAVIGGLNGVISGVSEIYDWRSPNGWLAFLSDSSWGLVGTTMGVLLHTVNLFYGSDRRYNSSLSRRQNRHVYDGGFGFGNFAFTQGNVISNLEGRHGSLLDHETLHVFQSRLFGPIFQTTYVAWLIVGAVVGFVAGLFVLNRQGLGQSIMDVAYLDNPWETWAYAVGGTANGGVLSYA